MPEMSDDVKKALEEQKKNCPFCKIIAGEIPSKKVYEDKQVIAVLDINPATKGHILVMPKEHYPILPYVPPETFKHLFEISQDISKCLKKSLARTGSNIFIANGWVAGQQSQHFMLHIIPRESGDGLFMFDMEGSVEDKEKADEAFRILSNNLPIMMNNHFKANPVDWHKPQEKEGEMQKRFTKEQVIQIIEQNPNLKDWLMKDPHSLVSQVSSHDQLKTLFADVDIHEVIKHFNKDYEPEKEPEIEEAEDTTEETKDSPEEESDEEIEDTQEDADTEEEIEGDEETKEDEDVLSELKGEEDSDEVSEDKDTEEELEDNKETEDDSEKSKEDEEADLDDIANLFK